MCVALLLVNGPLFRNGVFAEMMRVHCTVGDGGTDITHRENREAETGEMQLSHE